MIREKKLQQARLLEGAEQATCASPASHGKCHQRFRRAWEEQLIALESYLNQQLALLGERQLSPLFRVKKTQV